MGVAGSGNDTIQFSVTGTIALTSTLPGSYGQSTSHQRPSTPGITIDGGGFARVRVMQVASSATLRVDQLTISNGFSGTDSGVLVNSGSAIFNDSTLTINNTSLRRDSPESAAAVVLFLAGPLFRSAYSYFSLGPG